MVIYLYNCMWLRIYPQIWHVCYRMFNSSLARSLFAKVLCLLPAIHLVAAYETPPGRCPIHDVTVAATRMILTTHLTARIKNDSFDSPILPHSIP